MKTIEQADFKNNNFTFLRFFAASIVIFDHSFPLFGHAMVPYLFLLRIFGLLSLPVFFIISGFLITKSWLDSPKLFFYFKKRILRIFPGIILATLFCLFIIGPMTTTLNLKSYFSNSQTWGYLSNMVLITRHLLPGVFENNPHLGVNGSIWSLPYEFTMYIFIAAFGLVGILSKKFRILVLALLLFMIINIEMINRNPLASHLKFLFIFSAPLFIDLGIYFIVGALLYLYREKIKLNYWLAIFALILFVVPFRYPVLASLNYVSLSYLVIYFAFNINVNFLKNFGKFGDFSYGMYIFAFPVQQTFVYLFGQRMNFLIYIISVFFVTLILAFISWNLVEKQALKLKKVPFKIPNIFRRFARNEGNA